ncbi:hypothetical protein LPJ56_004930 [Coemansia sp. RSA 2599]|nr:hypothetical protein LPJ56_004930 [Coemansia sp. RSA 2599]
MTDAGVKEGAEMQLTKKQLKALQFRGKVEKQVKTEATKKEPSTEKKTSKADGKGRKKHKKDSQGNARDEPKQPENQKFEKKTNGAGNPVRFMVFVGNIPFKATADDLRQHLSSANPTSVRLMTNKETGKSRGFAFADFASAGDLKRALRFHHSRMGEKKINVELTAGGGGNSENRREKIKRRREDLEKERKRSAENKRQKTEDGDGDDVNDGNESPDQDNGIGSVPAAAPSASTSFAKRTAEKPVNEDTQQIEDYDTGAATKEKKGNRRKRGRGSRK